MDLPNLFTYIKNRDNLVDSVHNSNHCLDVLNNAMKYYDTIILPNINLNFLNIIKAICLLHEQNDNKFGLSIDKSIDTIKNMLILDNFNLQEINIIIDISKWIGFSKRNSRPNFGQFECIYNLISTADLLEAVCEKALDRSFIYQKEKLKRNGCINPDDTIVWTYVNLFFHDILDRIDYINIPQAKEYALLFYSNNLVELNKKLNNY
jgi:hypothetical protein